MINILDYEIKESLGKGGMATVYLAIHKRLQREVALKIMAPEVSATKAFQKSFFTEGRTVAKLEHPNIVKIYDINMQNGHFYMSMELLRKGNLKQRLANRKLPLSDVLDIITQIADALNYAHQRGFIHRDIKPANIMFREDGSAVLTDFGIAKIQGTTGEMTQMGYIAGTPYYMAPEQATGSHQVNERADIYSLSIVFYEMLTGSKPFVASNTVAITYKHVHDPIPTLQGENQVFQDILNKALAKKPEQRFKNIQDLSNALQDTAQLNAETQLISPVFYQNNTSNNKKHIWLWLIAIAITSVGGITGTYYYSKSTEEKRLIAEQVSFSRKVELQKAEEAKQKIKFAADKKSIRTGNINNHINLAKILDEKRRIFNHSDWSEGCKRYLEDIDGPYDPGETSEWHYQQVIYINKNNLLAQQALARISKRKQLEFTSCDNYQHSTKEDPLKGLFE